MPTHDFDTHNGDVALRVRKYVGDAFQISRQQGTIQYDDLIREASAPGAPSPVSTTYACYVVENVDLRMICILHTEVWRCGSLRSRLTTSSPKICTVWVL